MAQSGLQLPNFPPQWPEIAASIRASRLLVRDFETLCGFGGRFAGSESEKAAVAWLKSRIHRDFAQAPRVLSLPYDGWQRKRQRLDRLAPAPSELACHALVWSPPTPAGGLKADVVDLGRGTPDDIRERAEEIRGRIALVRHEYMFSSETVHRRVKYDAARAQGAVGFLIASHIPGEALVTGSSGRNGLDDIPAAAITQEGAAALASTGSGHARVRLIIDTGTAEGTAESLILDLPGRSPEWVVLSAHIDGHPLAESAMDNATGLATVLAAARAMAPHMGAMQRGLRLCLFNLEEWALAGSAHYLDRMTEQDRAAMALNINLDSVGGDPRLTALTSGYSKLEPFLRQIAGTLGVDLGFYRPMMRNSDHFNFARHGVPALRLVAGFNDPDSALRFVLTPEDRKNKVKPAELETSALIAAAVALRACSAPELDLRN